MAKNFMSEIAKLLGVEIGEPFYILQNGKHKCVYSDNDLYKITEEGLANINNTDGCYEYYAYWRVILTDLLLGECSVEQLPWEPKNCDDYYVLNVETGKIECYTWGATTFDLALKALGMVYRTREEAEAHLAENYERLTGRKLGNDA